MEEYTIYFNADLPDLLLQEEGKLRNLAQLMTQYPATRIAISGYTAMAGTEAGRLILSRERAQNVANYLTRQGIEAGRMELHWYGAERPVASNTTAEDMARNRRVEIIVLSD
jgi:outer membrane protein OmpA-like peptidoglycan-associated protein